MRGVGHEKGRGRELKEWIMEDACTGARLVFLMERRALFLTGKPLEVYWCRGSNIPCAENSRDG